MRILLFTLVLAFNVAAAWQERYQAGVALVKQGSLAQARVELSGAFNEARRAQLRGPELAAILYALGQMDMHEGRYRSASEQFGRALALLPEPMEDKVNILVDAAQASIALGDVSRATVLLRQGIGIRPNHTRVMQLLGTILYLNSRYEEAEALALKVIAYGTGTSSDVLASAQNLLATICLRRKRFREALEHVTEALSTAPPGQVRARIRANRASVWWQLGEKVKAASDLEAALTEAEAVLGKAHPEVATILAGYSVVLKGLGRKQDAKHAGERLREITSSFAAESNPYGIEVDRRDLRADVPAVRSGKKHR